MDEGEKQQVLQNVSPVRTCCRTDTVKAWLVYSPAYNCPWAVTKSQWMLLNLNKHPPDARVFVFSYNTRSLIKEHSNSTQPRDYAETAVEKQLIIMLCCREHVNDNTLLKPDHSNSGMDITISGTDRVAATNGQNMLRICAYICPHVYQFTMKKFASAAGKVFTLPICVAYTWLASS